MQTGLETDARRNIDDLRAAAESVRKASETAAPPVPFSDDEIMTERKLARRSFLGSGGALLMAVGGISTTYAAQQDDPNKRPDDKPRPEDKPRPDDKPRAEDKARPEDREKAEARRKREEREREERRKAQDPDKPADPHN